MIIKASDSPFLSVRVRDAPLGRSVLSIEPNIVIVGKRLFGSAEIEVEFKLTEGLLDFFKETAEGSPGFIYINDLPGVPIWAYEAVAVRSVTASAIQNGAI